MIAYPTVRWPQLADCAFLFTHFYDLMEVTGLEPVAARSLDRKNLSCLQDE